MSHKPVTRSSAANAAFSSHSSSTLPGSATSATGSPALTDVHPRETIDDGNDNNNDNEPEDQHSEAKIQQENPCSMLYEELKEEYNLSGTDKCPVCGVKMGFHFRRNHVPIPSAFSSPSSTSASSSSPVTTFMRVLPSIPKWTHKSVCKIFLQRTEQILSTTSVAKAEWNKIFPLLIEDTSAAEWVQQNIISKHLSWKNSCLTFTKHFQHSDYRLTLKKEFNNLQQRKGESAQSYSDRFTDITTQLGYEDDNDLCIQHYIDNLSPTLYDKLQQIIAFKLVDNPDYEINSLQQAINMSISFDVSNKNTQQQSHHSSESSSSHSTSNKKQRLICKFHPGIFSHNTADCRSKSSHPSSSQNNNNKSNSQSKSALTCYSCGQDGHISPNCPKKNMTSNSTPASSASPWKSLSNSSSSSSSLSKPAQQQQTTTKTQYSSTSTIQPKPVARSINIKSDTFTDSDSDIFLSSVTVASAPGKTTCSSLLDRTPPPNCFLPTKHSVLFLFNNCVYSTLLDTGATTSIIDKALVEELDLPVNKITGKISLAHKDVTTDRIGTTQQLNVTALFPNPRFRLPSTSVVHSFEIMSLPSASYSFIIGTDLIPLLFPSSIPIDFILSPSLSASIPILAQQQWANVSYVVPASATYTAPIAHHSEFESSNATSTNSESVSVAVHGPTVSVVNTSVMVSDHIGTQIPSDKLIPGLNNLNQQINEFGAGVIPPEELPVKPELFTSEELEAEYSAQRERILRDPEIIAALDINAGITGFCNIPESVVRLEINPDLKHKLYRRQYKIAAALMPLANEVIERWLQEGKIELAPAGCEFNNPLTIAPKKDDSGTMTGIRVCLDTRALNNALVMGDKFEIPNIKDVLESFAGNKIFGEVDLSEAYLQFALHPDSKKYTAFTWNNVQYVFNGSPFGLTNLPGHFQRGMSFTFSDVKSTFPFFDNVPFASRTWQEHRDTFLFIINRLNQVNLRIKPSSIKIGQSNMTCLGHMLSVHGIGIDYRKLSAIRDWPLPKSNTELQSFLGFATFLRQNVRHFGDLTAPLEAVKNNKEIIWTPLLLQHFELTKEAICKAPFLAFPDFSLPFHVATDASNTGVGGILYQPTDGSNEITSYNIVGIVSKKLSKSQMNYSAYKKELYGVIYSLRQFHSYIWGRIDTVIHTDHKPLVHMLTSTDLSPALQIWLDVLLDYTFTIHHRAGILNVLPDALSRMYASAYTSTWGVATTPLSSLVVTESDSSSTSDTSSTQHHSTVSVQSTLSVCSLSFTDPTSTSSAPIFMGEGIAISAINLQVEMETRGKIIPPESERVALIQKEHALGHFGIQSVYKSLYKKNYWWPEMRLQIQNEISNCDPCTRFTVVKSGFNPSSYITAGGPWEHIQIDTSVHLPPSPNGYTCLLVVIDVFTGYVLLRPMKTTTAEIVANELWNIFAAFGLPKILQSDNGPEFTNDVLRALVKLCGIEHRFISPYNPRCDGKVERSIGTVMGIIKKLLHGTTNHWPLFVPFAQLSFNNKISSLTNSSPFSLMFGRSVNELKDYTSEDVKIISLDHWRQHQEKILSLIFPAISDNIKVSKDKMIQTINKHRRTLLANNIPNGAIVMIKDVLRANKWEAKYVGPYTAIRRTRNGNYVLRDSTGDILDRHIPPDQIKLVSRKPRESDLQNNVYEIESISKHRGSPGNHEYYVKWKNYHERTWEPASSFLDNKVITDYWKHLAQ